MRNHTLVLSTLLLGLTGFLAANCAIADPSTQMQAMHGAQKTQHGMIGQRKHKSHRGHRMHGQRGNRLLSPHWRQTLTKDQQIQIDQMHLEFAKVKMTLKARINTLKVELALLCTADTPNPEAIENKIEEVLVVKRNMMRIHSEHIVNMRKVLNSEQRMSFDLDVLHRMGRGKGKHH